MLPLKTGVICLLLSLCAVSTSAQTVSPKRDEAIKKSEMFNDLPQRMPLPVQVFAALLQKEIGEKVSLPIAAGFTFLGTVVSKSDAAEERCKTVVIKSSNRQGTAFTITGIKKGDGTFRYSGRMLSLKHSDAYELTEDAGQFALEKKPLNELVTE